MVNVGFILNPIAGMGGSVGLKGTDGLEEEAKTRGAEPVAPRRAKEFLEALPSHDAQEIAWTTCAEPMGHTELEKFVPEHKIVHWPQGTTSGRDTTAAAAAMKGSGCEMIVFCGGDGTARDVFEAVGSTVPILGIPAGVKMYSGVFAITPRAGAQLLAAYARGEASLGEAEITDIDEGAYRKDIVSTSLYGIAKTIYEPLLVPASKEAVVGPEEDAYKEDIARTVIESMEDDTLYIFGAGSTTARIMESMGLEHTLLGIDGAMNGKLVTKDADEATLLRLLESPVQVRLILSPLGAKGVLIGRGTGPLTPAVMKRIGIDNVVAVATPLKLSRLKQLLVDTGNKELDERFSKKGYLSVINGYRTSTIKK